MIASCHFIQLNFNFQHHLLLGNKKKKKGPFPVNEFGPGGVGRDLEATDAMADILKQITWTESCRLFNGNPYSSRPLFLPRAKDHRSQSSISSYLLPVSRCRIILHRHGNSKNRKACELINHRGREYQSEYM